MASLDMSSFDDILKIHYAPMRVENMVYRNEPFLAMLPKMTEFGGKSLPVPLQYAPVGGRSQDFTTAQANTQPSSFGEFSLTRVHDYAVAHVDNETMEASMGNENAFLQAATTEINSAIRAITRSLATALARDGTGAIGVIDTVTDGSGIATIVLATIDDIVNFEVNMTLVAADSETGAPFGAGEGTGYRVTNVDRDTGTLIVNGTAAATSGWDAGDVLFVQGDAYGVTGASRKLSGVPSWIPSSVTSDSFFGQDRTKDKTRLGGVRYDGSSETIEEALISAAARLGREGGSPDVVIMNNLEWARLAKELGGRIRYDNVMSSNGKISFSALALATPKGDVKVVADHNFVPGTAYMLQLDTWKLYSLGAAPKILTYNDNAGQWLRRSTADGVELRVGYYAQLGNSAPGYNARVTLPS